MLNKNTHCKQHRTAFGVHRMLGGLPRHHCRKCGNIFCAECSSHYALHPATGLSVRVCNRCDDEIGKFPRKASGWRQNLLSQFGLTHDERFGYSSDDEAESKSNLLLPVDDVFNRENSELQSLVRERFFFTIFRCSISARTCCYLFPF
jgi:hypothetical protein